MNDDIELDYDYLMQKAFRYLMRDVLIMVAELGDAPGEHHFYIEFVTEAPGVSIPDHLKQEYPERMTIVLQHQFDGLKVTDEGFEVILWFKSIESHLVIPFDAVTSFADPSTEFGLRFEPREVSETDPEQTDPAQPGVEAEISTLEIPKDTNGKEKASNTDADNDGDKKEGDNKDGDKNAGDGADIVSLDAFRKK